ncbi:MAG: RsmE family RNA methyltransferase [Verrucomicrobiota bacterium]
MHRFFLPPDRTRGDVLALSEEDAHHAARVLRVQVGEPVVVLDGAGGELACVVASAGKRDVTVRVVKRTPHPPRAAEVTLVQAIAKTKAMDGILQKSVELGAARVVPLVADRSISVPGDAEDKRSKWQTIATEAAKQCGAVWLTRVDAPQSPSTWIRRGERFDLVLIGSLLDEPRHARTHFERFLGEHGRLPRSVAVIVGPEGDFTTEEYAAFKAAGAKAITLGPLVLRCETAATYCLAVVNHELSAVAGGSGR